MTEMSLVVAVQMINANIALDQLTIAQSIAKLKAQKNELGNGSPHSNEICSLLEKRCTFFRSTSLQ